MPLSAHLKIKLPSTLSVALEKALKPDNAVPPKGFEIMTYTDNCGFHLLLKSYGRAGPKAILTSLSVIDEVTELTRSLIDVISKAEITNSYKPSFPKEE